MSLYLIDGYNLAFRAYYAYSSVQNNYSQNINCLYGFCQMLDRIMRYHNPGKLAVIFDARNNFRKKIYPEYKQNRSELDIELIMQLAFLRTICDEFKINHFEMDGYEADDVIATFAKKCVNDYKKITIVSVDKDLCQLVNETVQIFHPMKKIFIDQNYVLKEFGVVSSDMADLQAIIGDSVDNIPGIKGIGIKTAAPIVKEYNTLENIYQNIDSLEISPRYMTLFKNGKDNAFLSRRLTQLNDNLDISKNIECEFDYTNFAARYKNFVYKLHL